MKTILLALLLSFNIFAQGEFIILLTGNRVSYDADAQTYFSAMATPLSSAYKTRINTFVTMVKDSLSISNLSDKFDIMYLLANETSEAGLKNLVKRSHDATIGATTVTFTADQGFTGDGVAGYITTNYNPSTDAVIYTLNSASLGYYSRTSSASTAIQDIGVNATTNVAELLSSWSDGNAYWGVNSNTHQDQANIVTDGLLLVSRTASGASNFYINGAVVGGESSIASAAIPNGDITILARNLGGTPDRFSNRQLAFVFVGEGLDATEVRKLNNCIEWYMDDLGTGVQ